MPGRLIRYPYVQSRRRSNGTLAHRGYVDEADGRRFGETFDDPLDAHLDALRMRGAAAPGTTPHSLDDAIDALLSELRVKRTTGTVRWYADHLRAICRSMPGDGALSAITRATVEAYIKERLCCSEGKRKCTAATVNADLRALHRVFAFAIARDVVKTNPVVGIARPRADAPAIDWFTEDEFRVDVLGRIPEQRTRDVLQLMVSTGVRRREATCIEPGHVRITLEQLIVPGKNRVRVIPLPPSVHGALGRLLAAAEGHRFLLPGGTHALDDLFRDAKQQVGDRRLHAHALRHTFCTTLIRMGVRPDVVMRLADHKDIKTTMRYVHEVGDDCVQAMKLLRFEPPPANGSAVRIAET